MTHNNNFTNTSSIRPMLPTDIPQVYAIEKVTQVVSWSEGIFYDCLQAGYNGWVIERNEIVEGYILAYTRVAECHILNVCVKRDVQNNGHGRRLLQHALQDAKQRGAEVIFLEVRPSNANALHLYRQLGFNEVGIRKDYYTTPEGGFEDALVFALQL